MKFNINERVKVKLTVKGIEHLKKQHERIMKNGYPYEFKLPQVDKDGYTEFQLHDLMQTFGEIMFPGCELPFKTDIIIPDEKLKP